MRMAASATLSYLNRRFVKTKNAALIPMMMTMAIAMLASIAVPPENTPMPSSPDYGSNRLNPKDFESSVALCARASRSDSIATALSIQTEQRQYWRRFSHYEPRSRPVVLKTK